MYDLKLRDRDGAAHGEGWSGRQSVSFVRVINIKVLIRLRYEQRHQRKQGVITTRQVPRYYCRVLLKYNTRRDKYIGETASPR